MTFAGARDLLARASRAGALALPLPLALRALEAAKRTATPHGFMPDFAARTLDLDAAAQRAWFERAWWGQHANALVGEHLARGHHAAVDAITDTPDLAPPEGALAARRGVLFVGAHLGPPVVAPLLIGRRIANLLVGVWSPQPGLAGIRVEVLADPETRRRFLVEAMRHLRAGGAVFVGADGRSDPFRLHGFMKGNVKLSRGPASLARTSRAVTFPVSTVWTGHRLRLTLGAAIDPQTASADAWETQWQEAFLRFIEAAIRETPESVGLRKITLLRSYHPDGDFSRHSAFRG